MLKILYQIQNIVYVGIHIRRGDLSRYYYLQAPPKEFFDRAMKYYNDRYPDRVVFIVCSEDMEWSKSNIKNTRPVIFSEDNSFEVDFAILTRCNHSVRSLGSFGDWSGYLAQGTVVYYNNSVIEENMGTRSDGSTKCDRLDKEESYFPRLIFMG